MDVFLVTNAMKSIARKVAVLLLVTATAGLVQAQQASPAKPADTEVWEPIPKAVTPGKTCSDAPSDAVILFDGKIRRAGIYKQKENSPAISFILNTSFL